VSICAGREKLPGYKKKIIRTSPGFGNKKKIVRSSSKF